MENNHISTWKPQQQSKGDIKISHLELRFSAPNVDDLNTSCSPQTAGFYQELSGEIETVGSGYWVDRSPQCGSVHEEVTSSGDSTLTSSTLDHMSLDSERRYMLPPAQKAEDIVRRAVRKQLQRLNPAANMPSLDEVVLEIREMLLKSLGRAFLDTKPTNPEICYYVLQEASASKAVKLLCQLQLSFTKLASGGTVSSDGRTEASFKIVAKDQSSWEIYAPHSALIALHESLEKHAGRKLPAFPRPDRISMAYMQKMEAYLEGILQLPIKLLLESKEVRTILTPVAGSPIYYDEVYDESLCYRLAKHCCWGERCSCV